MKLIDKDALVAKIKERLTEIEKLSRSKESGDEYGKGFCDGRRGAYRKILSSVNSLEVKEAEWTEEDMKLIWTIGDELPYMSEEDFYKELLKRYKAQKGESVT